MNGRQVPAVISQLHDELERAGVRFHRVAYEARDEVYFLIHRNDALILHRFIHSSYRGKVSLLHPGGISKRQMSDVALITGVGVHLVDGNCFVLLCDQTPVGWWRTKFRASPIRRAWPPKVPGGGYSKGRFVTDQGIAFVPCESKFSRIASPPADRPGAIDVVYTWVDSDDYRWQLKKALVGAPTEIKSADHAYRYQSRNELMFSMRSVRAYAPWVRNIFVVTDEQCPSWLQEVGGVKVVDHKEIFPDGADLPVFNSHAIEANLHRIHGLSEFFIYFNDDVFLGRPVTPWHFFTKQGRSKISPTSDHFIDLELPEDKRVPTDFAGYNMQASFLREMGVMPVLKMMHVPHAVRRSVMQEICDRFPQEVRQTIAAKVRSASDIALPSMFYPYYAWATGRAEIRKVAETSYVYLDLGRETASLAVDKLLANPPHFFCANVTFYEENDAEAQSNLLERLFSLFPNPAPWERAA